MIPRIVLTKSQAWALYCDAMDVVQARGTLDDWCAAIAAAKVFCTWSTPIDHVADTREMMPSVIPTPSQTAKGTRSERHSAPRVFIENRARGNHPVSVTSVLPTPSTPDFVKPFKHGPIPDYRPASVRDLNRGVGL